MKSTPNVLDPLQIEIHCGGDLYEDVDIYFEHQNKFSLKYRGLKFIEILVTELKKNRWLRSNFYSIVYDKDTNRVSLKYSPNQDNLPDSKKIYPLYDINIQGEEDLYLRMPIMQELKVIFLNLGGIMQEVVKETYKNHFHYFHIYHLPY